MRLTELEPHFLKVEDDRTSVMIDDLAAADGIDFLCPKCFQKNGGKRGTHSIICWFAGRVPDGKTPGPGRWTPSGTGYHDLTFVPGNPPRSTSVLQIGGCAAHFFIENGEIRFT